MRMRKLGIIMLVLISFVLTGCGNKKNDQLIMITEAGFAPYEYYEGNEIIGVDIQIAQEIAKSMDKELVVKDVAFDSIINELNSGKADFAAAGMSITEERKKRVDFSVEYAISNQVVVVKKNSNIELNKLDGKKIAVQLGSVADSYATKNYPNATIIRQKKYLTAAEDVKNNKADCIIMDSLPAKELVEKNQELKILDGILFTDKYGMAVKKGNKELLAQINKVLEQLMKEKKIEEYVIQFSK